MIKPLVSVITPTYNSSNFIVDTVISVLKQTYQNFELIIVDDCSTDNTWEIIQELQLKDTRIRTFKMNRNSGAALTRNFAIERANGNFIAFLDSDDLWMKNKLELQVQFMLQNEYAFTYTDYLIIDEEGRDIKRTVSCPEIMDYNKLLKNTIIGCLTVMIDVNKLGKPIMPNIQPEDTALWLKILQNGHKAYCINETLAKYRIVSNSVSSNKIEVSKKMWRVYRHSENIGFFKSLWYFSNYAWNAVKKHYL